jgi:hypothetical protein
MTYIISRRIRHVSFRGWLWVAKKPTPDEGVGEININILFYLDAGGQFCGANVVAHVQAGFWFADFKQFAMLLASLGQQSHPA